MKVHLKHESGLIKECKVGFSWTVFFFGFFPPLFRGDWKWALILVIVDPLTFSMASLVLSFIYNGIYIKDLLQNGYKPADEHSRNVLVNKGYIV